MDDTHARSIDRSIDRSKARTSRARQGPRRRSWPVLELPVVLMEGSSESLLAKPKAKGAEARQPPSGALDTTLARWGGLPCFEARRMTAIPMRWDGHAIARAAAALSRRPELAALAIRGRSEGPGRVFALPFRACPPSNAERTPSSATHDARITHSSSPHAASTSQPQP